MHHQAVKDLAPNFTIEARCPNDKIVEAIRPKNFGVIVRTAAEGKSTAELHQDMLSLVETWKTIQANLKGAVAPVRILSEETKTTSTQIYQIN